MIKTIDIDKIFDKYIGTYVYKNIGKIKPEEIEDHIPTMYEEFGNTALPELDGKTPNEYYRDFSAEELIAALKEHVEKGVPVSDFLSEGIINAKDGEAAVVSALKDAENDEFIAYLLNIHEIMNAESGLNEILNLIICDYPENVTEIATEILSSKADKVKDAVLNSFDSASEKAKECFAEILSHAGRDEKVLSVLVAEFIRHGDRIAQYAGYLSRFGDERALPYLLTAIENEKIRYADFVELRFAIESLGGEYKKERDFTGDKDYGKIKGTKKNRII